MNSFIVVAAKDIIKFTWCEDEKFNDYQLSSDRTDH